MKQLTILLIALALLTACNQKGGGNDNKGNSENSTEEPEAAWCDCRLDMAIYRETPVEFNLYKSKNQDPLRNVITNNDGEGNYYHWRVLIDKGEDGWFHINKVTEYDNPTMTNIDPATQLQLTNGVFSNKWIKDKKLYLKYDSWVYAEVHQEPNVPWIYAEPDIKSEKLGKIIPPEDKNTNIILQNKLKIKGCCKEWIYAEVVMEDNSITGWIPYYTFCADPYAECNQLPEQGFNL